MGSSKRLCNLAEKHIVLVGLPGVGKTSVGEALARLSSRPFVDIDRMLKILAPQSDDLIVSGDWVRFRLLEASVATKVLEENVPQVIAFGGATMISEAVRPLALRASVVVHLDEEVHLISSRLATSPRRMFDGQDVQSMLIKLQRQRSLVYAQAHMRIEGAGRSCEALAAAVFRQLEDACRYE